MLTLWRITDNPDQPTKKAHNSTVERQGVNSDTILIPLVSSKNPLKNASEYPFEDRSEKRDSAEQDMQEKKQTKAHTLKRGVTLSVIAFVREKLFCLS